MFSETLKVRFYETDALQHVSNTVIVGWFEAAREPIFQLFGDQMDVNNWPIILASYKVDFRQQIYFGQPVEIKTAVSRIGNSSFEVYQQVWQDGKLCAEGHTTMVHFDFSQQCSKPLPGSIKQQLEQHLVDAEKSPD